MSEAYRHGVANPNHEISVDDLPITGTIPAWLRGTLLRNGPGALQAGVQGYRHWFDGLAMLHKFSFEDGRVNYASKYLDSKSYRGAQEQGRIAYTEFATDPCRSLFERATIMFTNVPSDNAKVAIAKFADQMIALAETPIQVLFDQDTLETAGVFHYEDNLQGQMTTAHPHFAEGAMWNIVTRFNAVSQYHLQRVEADMQPSLAGSVNVLQPSYMHSFGLTENYAIITGFPLVVNPIHLLLWLKPFIENFRWEPQRGTPFWVINRHTGELVGRYECDPFFAFHHVNAFERDDEIILDMVSYPDADIITEYYLHRLEADDLCLPQGKLTRYTLPLSGKRVTYATLSDTGLEMPHFDYSGYNGNPDYRYVYGIGVRDARRHEFYNQLVKIDAQTGDTLTWHMDDCFPGEAVFVPAPERQAEDAGVLLSVVLDAAAGDSFLLVLDAHDLSEIGRARIPQPVLFGFHGLYVD